MVNFFFVKKVIILVLLGGLALAFGRTYLAIQTQKNDYKLALASFLEQRLKLRWQDAQESQFNKPVSKEQFSSLESKDLQLGQDLCPLLPDLTKAAYFLKDGQYIKFYNYRDFDYPAWGKVVADKGTYSIKEGRVFFIPHDLKTWESFPLREVAYKGERVVAMDFYGIPMHKKFCLGKEVDQRRKELINL